MKYALGCKFWMFFNKPKKKYLFDWNAFLSKGRYMFGNCQRPVFSLGVSHHNHKIISLWKCGLNWSSKLRGNYERKNTLVGRNCVLSDKNKRLLARREVFNYLSEKLPLSRKISYFRGSHFPQCFILSTAPRRLLPISFSVNICFE